ncbi:exopolysaccharide biosynthesis protein [Sporomusaceae bacterium BoRhaA]|uniref:phosphodiester glycosidase family protein n=1 Tax=Pelorhabdus rhamnosifermentans TaxID=2772457 RepID=UPI001C060D36|nr:phosphodiester glycosidase family protein [Pelorhabdus rhamnosifermentans]MBU2698959.1 exopolysaccharide biosynthesis protein [Pelorhabdus rhamnosifermentans]
MKKIVTRLVALGLFLLILSQTVFAFAAPASLQKMRYSQATDKVRIVLDVSAVPSYTVDTTQDGQIRIDLPGTTVGSALAALSFKDDAVDSAKLIAVDSAHQQLVITLKSTVVPKVFVLQNPNRLVIDLVKNNRVTKTALLGKTAATVAPGLTYTSLVRNKSFGPVVAYILDADLSKIKVQPALSNGMIAGLESVQDMAVHNQALAAVNGSYFAPNGEIIGLLKMNNVIASIPYITRTALGITTDNKLIFGQVDYQGNIRLPDGRVLAINGINCERSEDAVTLYNSYYGKSTQTNEFGKEYVITNGKVSAISPQDTPLKPGSIVLSAHGAAATVMAGLKVGDSVVIEQSLGPDFDKVPFAIGAGPLLVKDGKPFLTTKAEEFPDDIAVGRAPRTALGVTKSGHLLMVVIDGRQAASKGLTLVELADFMQELGADEAMNFDGGGSSEMVVKGSVMNNPSDGQERLVGDAIVLTAK